MTIFCNSFLSAERTFNLQLQTFSADLTFCNLAALSAGPAANLRQCHRVTHYSALGAYTSAKLLVLSIYCCLLISFCKLFNDKWIYGQC